ncbi:MAG: hypothetical protein OM95_09650 [Bdellovibrio sp. ArHS]|uniref:hypothetical protein n=1 Tax=Bdellovibrio sp. ArHS TaxID=1569284 RepID=UPI00058309C1|nr:hypothetical protein [Bdellovibrio sp. ArHS]KHD88387.1 MAG: hypothetical protein OM95_09650 [Bdellovibrio sp. ArHS]
MTELLVRFMIQETALSVKLAALILTFDADDVGFPSFQRLMKSLSVGIPTGPMRSLKEMVEVFA